MTKTKITALLAAVSLLCGCSVSENGDIEKRSVSGNGDIEKSSVSENVNIEKLSVDNEPVTVEGEADVGAITDFSLRLFGSVYSSGENTMLSPISVMYALGMTTLGARDSTLTQMEDVLGLDRDELPLSLNLVKQGLKNGEGEKTVLADSIWFRNTGFTPNESFLSECSSKYDAELYSAPFDEETKNRINSWIDENTDGMIKDVLDEIPEAAVMYLINTLAFDCEWDEMYSEHQVRTGDFTDEDGSVREVEFMSSEESAYIEGEDYTGFIKYYKNHDYGFAAFLPNEGVTLNSLVSSLDSDELHARLTSPETQYTVYAKLPKFSYEYSNELSDELKNMGMTDAFDEDKADFGGVGSCADGNLYLSRVIHKTFIEAAEQGTKAGAATVVEMVAECAIEPSSVRTVELDRPYLFVIFENETGVPLFIGTYEK